jgi:hypothetical protein
MDNAKINNLIKMDNKIQHLRLGTKLNWLKKRSKCGLLQTRSETRVSANAKCFLICLHGTLASIHGYAVAGLQCRNANTGNDGQTYENENPTLRVNNQLLSHRELSLRGKDI